jgi:hypothetical protein
MRAWVQVVRPRRVVPALAALALAAGGASLALGAGTAAAAVVPACTSADITWTALSPTSSTVTLVDPTFSCWVSLNSYDTAGATWATSGTQTADGHDSVELMPSKTTATLSAPFTKNSTCFGQTDLYGGTQLFDGTDGALPLYPGTVTPLNLLAFWNGSTTSCTPASSPTPPPVVSTPPPTTGTTPTVPTPTVSLTTVTPQFPTVTGVCSSTGSTVSSYVVPSLPIGVEYWVNGAGPVAGGTVEKVAPGASSVLSVTNTPGYTLGSSSTTTTLVASGTIPCPHVVVPPKPQGVLGVTVSTPTKPVSVLPLTLTKPPTATLPFTGLPTTEVALFGFAFIAAGGTLLVATRRRQAQRGSN